MTDDTAPQRSFVRRVQDGLRYRAFRQKWNIGVVQTPIAVVAGLAGSDAQREALRKVVWMPEEPDLFRADPFPVPNENGGIDIFFEQLRWSEGRGTIEGVTFDGASFSPVRRVLRLNHHLSYPYTIADGGAWHVLPEQAEGQVVARYPVPFKASAGQPIITGKRLLDASVITHEGRYWMFATHLGPRENEDLFLYYAQRLDGPWIAAGGGPVKSDATAARPAGHLFWHDGAWYRPAQNCARYYGESIAVHRITDISTTGYAEEKVTEIRPLLSARYQDGLHTISGVGDWTVIDGARLESTITPLLDTAARWVRYPSFESEAVATKVG